MMEDDLVLEMDIIEEKMKKEMEESLIDFPLFDCGNVFFRKSVNKGLTIYE